ncbi:MAG TPA: hypothetical protein VLC98_02950 [Phnomibacter sp.]|nr:hypothetical protein [Phnomibacter sp.]
MKILGAKGVKKSKIASIYSSEYGKNAYYTVLLYIQENPIFKGGAIFTVKITFGSIFVKHGIGIASLGWKL